MNVPVFRQAQACDLERCYEIETIAYEGDEAATKEKIAQRIAQYPEGFLVLEVAGELIGFINSGCAQDVKLSDEHFKELIGHDPAAPNVVIMSLVIDPRFQGKGYASLLMRRFIADMRARGKTSIHLMCKSQHIPLYEHWGYRYVKPSDSCHGGMSWHDMVRSLSQ